MWPQAKMMSDISLLKLIRNTASLIASEDKDEYYDFVKDNLSNIFECYSLGDSHKFSIIKRSCYFVPLFTHLATIEACILNMNDVKIKNKIPTERKVTCISKKDFILEKHSLYRDLKYCDLLFPEEIEEVILSYQNLSTLHNPGTYTNNILKIIEEVFSHIQSNNKLKEFKTWQRKELFTYIEDNFPQYSTKHDVIATVLWHGSK